MDASSHSRDFPCRFCQAPLTTTFVDLGMSPLCQTHISRDQLHEMEPFYPLHAYVCDQCFLVQLAGVRHARRDLHRVRLLLVVLDRAGSSTRGATPR